MRTRLLLAALLITPLARAESDEDTSAPRAPTFKAPGGWKAEKAGDFGVMARFRVGEGDAAVHVAVVALKGEGGGAIVNVNRWRAQVGLKALDDEGAKRALRPAKVDGVEGHSLDVSGPDGGARPQQRILVT